MSLHQSHTSSAGPARAIGAIILALCLVTLLAPPTTSLAQGRITGATIAGRPAQGALQNADLEDGFEAVAGGGSVAAQWSPWWVEGSDEQVRQGILRPPTFDAETRLSSAAGPPSGALAQRLASTYATHEGGIYQRVSVAPGSVVRFSMWVHVWSSSSDDSRRSHKPGDYRVSVGIDPYGGTDGTSPAIVWSPDIVEYDGWVKLSASATARSDTITLFARGACSWRVKHNESVWDDAAIHVVPPAAVYVAAAPLPAANQAPLPALAAAATPAGTALADTDAPSTLNALQNPDFEEAFTERGAGEVAVATGWHPWWEDGSEAEIAEGYLFRPEFKPERRGQGCGRVHAMNAAQKQFTTYATHRAGIYQRVPVTPGSGITFSIWAYVWSSAGDDPEVSEDPGDYRVSVGIDPTGGTDGTSPDIVWSQPRHAYDRWVELTVTAVARGSAITVFTRGEPTWRVKHNDAYWDDALLIVGPGSATNTLHAATAAGGLVPGKARVLSQEAPSSRPSMTMPTQPTNPSPATAAPTAATGWRPAGNVPDVARVPRPLGEETSLSYAGPHLSLTWQRGVDGVTIELRAPAPVEGELALWHEGQESARWAIAVLPEDPLTIHRPDPDLNAGDLGVLVRDPQGNVLARCGSVP